MSHPRVQSTPAVRLQGTDGIRREVRPSTHPGVAGCTPQQAFLEKHVITDSFLELYAYAHLRVLEQHGEFHPGDAVVAGWDPRDASGVYTGAVVRGLRKAGARVCSLGVVPTPLVPMFLLAHKAAAGVMITASHNPPDQNGVKLFEAARGLKLLPENDVELTRRVLSLDWRTVAALPVRGSVEDRRAEAVELFLEFSLDRRNSWIGGQSFADTTLVVDPAFGSLSGLAAEAFRRAGFGEVIEVNAAPGEVNRFSGVADLEGKKIIPAGAVDGRGGAFRRHAAILKLFQAGRRHRRAIAAGRRWVCGAVFDADADRFYRLDYHPGQDALLVLSGDETAVLQARHLLKREPLRYRNAAFIHTVESDLNAGQAVRRMGLQPILSPVGDKWILLRVAGLSLRSRLQGVLTNVDRRGANQALRRQAKILNQECSTRLSAGVQDFRAIAAMEKKLAVLEPRAEAAGDRPAPFAVGAEETGHNITAGVLGGAGEVFCGNGLKSALNTFAAVQELYAGRAARTRLAALAKPFPPGFKKTLYVYYVAKERFAENTAVWRRLRSVIGKEAARFGFRCGRLSFREERDMLYLELRRGRGKTDPVCGVFVRNSGTEDKIGVNLRGGMRDARALRSIGDAALRILLAEMKETANRYYKLELEALAELAARPLRDEDVAIPPETRARLLNEMRKQDLIARRSDGANALTPLGRWYLTASPA